MPIDPRMFLGINGPVGPQPLVSGFRPPGPAAGAPMMQPPGQPQLGIPSMGLGKLPGGIRPSTSGAVMGEAENNGLAGAVSGIQGLKPNPDGTWPQPPMPTDIGSGGGGSNWPDWLRKLF